MRAAVQLKSGQPAQAEPALRRHLRTNPGDPDANRLLGLALLQQGQGPQAEFFAKRATELKADPANFDVLGATLMVVQKFADAEKAFAKGCELGPQIPSLHYGRGAALMQLEDPEAAATCFARSLQLNPDNPEAAGFYASALQNSYRVAESLDTLRRGVARWPQHLRIRHQLAVLCNYVGVPAPETFEHHRVLGALMDDDARQAGAGPVRFNVTPEPDRPLRVGLVSPDFREHSVARFVESLVANSGDSVTYVAFSAVPKEDATTARLRKHMPEWHDVRQLSDAKLALLCRQQRIDIAIDLTGHTISTRLAAFCHHAAPVQATAIGYPNTTGLSVINWRVGDAITDPAGEPRLATELTLRVEPCFLCFAPPPEAPEIKPREPGPIRFGSFNALKKLSPATLELWSGVLAAVPGSRLVLKAYTLDKPEIRDRVLAALEAAGIPRDRVDILPPAPTIAAHLAAYHQVDIALDAFPYHGTTTTCEAMWMGVPVVTLKGDTHASRVGASLLTASGQADRIATTPEQFITIARDLAADPARLAFLRAGLRDQMRASPLCDGPAYAKAFEVVLRHAWHAWCVRQ
jgi:predicted O-linked N-acetylglucosamine transferase (SPINDLY family)